MMYIEHITMAAYRGRPMGDRRKKIINMHIYKMRDKP